MKIVNLKTFKSLPKGTVFSKYMPSVFDGLMIKDTSWDVDFLYQDLIGNIDADSSDDFYYMCQAAERGESLNLDFDTVERDGLFEDNQLFAIYETNDVEGLICRLLNGLRDSREKK